MRLIDADAIPWCNYDLDNYLYFVGVDKEYVDELPTIEAEPVKHGRWEEHPHSYGFKRCSVCHDCNIWGEWADGKKWGYCPDCGAKMDLEG